MAKLVLTVNGSIEGNYFLEKASLNIGRLPHNHIVLDAEGVSKVHASILVIGNDHIVEDMQSSNGTVVNGRRIERQVLQHGDIVQIAGFNLKYMNTRAVNSDLDRTTFLAGADLPTHGLRARNQRGKTSGGLQAATARSAKISYPAAALEVLSGLESGKRITLQRIVTLIGSAGRQTAVLARRPHGHVITHVEGANTPRVNNRNIGTEHHLLTDKDMIEVDGMVVRYRQS